MDDVSVVITKRLIDGINQEFHLEVNGEFMCCNIQCSVKVTDEYVINSAKRYYEENIRTKCK